MSQASSIYKTPGKQMNLADVFVERNVREGRGAKVAVVVDHPERGVERYTYADVSALAARYGHELRARGLGIEDRVFIILEDGIEWVAAFFGAQKIGATTMFLNPVASAEELAFYLEDSRARGVVTTKAVAARLPAARPFLRTVLEVDDAAVRASIAARPATLDTAPTLEEDFAIWLYSSGSTGAPKAAVHRAYDFVYNTERYAKHVLRMTEADVTLSVPKLFFGYATGSNLFFPLHFGGTAVLFPDKPTPERLFELTARHRATMLVNVPTMIAQMAVAWDKAEQKPDVSSLRVLTSAGEALPPELYRRWKDATGVEILDGIGSAEMFHVFISARFGEVVPGSLGTLVEGYDAKIVDQDGRVCGPNEVGTLWVWGDSAAAFYWQRHEKSRDVLQARWVVTGDQFVRDENGLFWYRGRADDLLKVAGRWVAPQEIEDALTTHAAVAEAGVAPFTEEGLVKPMAFVVLRPGFDASEALARSIQDHVAAKTLPFKAPRFVEFVDALPRGDRDKLARKELKQLAEAAAKRRSAS
ncbi:benzoate-CoA ligase family protein [Myxococcota bacterium]|nr:benzoate-CoA ligase family protein [Myxococcota bacterium]